MVFVICLGFYITPQFLGGGRVTTISMKIQQNVATYFDWAMRLVRLGGMIVAHNVLLGGRVAEQASRTDDEDVRAMRAFNTRVAGERRATSILMPAYDGFMVAVVNSR